MGPRTPPKKSFFSDWRSPDFSFFLNQKFATRDFSSFHGANLPGIMNADTLTGYDNTYTNASAAHTYIAGEWELYLDIEGMMMMGKWGRLGTLYIMWWCVDSTQKEKNPSNLCKPYISGALWAYVVHTFGIDYDYISDILHVWRNNALGTRGFKYCIFWIIYGDCARRLYVRWITDFFFILKACVEHSNSHLTTLGPLTHTDIIFTHTHITWCLYNMNFGQTVLGSNVTFSAFFAFLWILFLVLYTEWQTPPHTHTRHRHTHTHAQTLFII